MGLWFIKIIITIIIIIIIATNVVVIIINKMQIKIKGFAIIKKEYYYLQNPYFIPKEIDYYLRQQPSLDLEKKHCLLRVYFQ
jgi:hypothetical protein